MTGQPLTPEREQEIREALSTNYLSGYTFAADCMDVLTALDAARAERDKANKKRGEAGERTLEALAREAELEREVAALRAERDELKSWRVEAKRAMRLQRDEYERLEREVAALREAVQDWIDSGDPGYPPVAVREALGANQ